MANNLTIESPNFQKITKEAGEHTSSAINLLWAALNDTRKSERIDFRRASDMLAPKILEIDAGASQDNLDLQGCSVVSFTGASAQNLTGFRAPDTGKSRVVIITVSGAGTITVQHNLTSETQNRIFTQTAAAVAIATNQGMILTYTAGRWRQVN